MTKFRLSISFFAALVFSCGAVLAQTGLSPEMQKELTKAGKGDAQAQFRLAVAYNTGKGAPRDAKEALKWYQAAAERGHAEAQNRVGTGLLAERRFAEALPWFEKAAAQEHPAATNNLATHYDLGLGADQDRKKAFDLYLKAADLGWPEAMGHLSMAYEEGQVVKRDAHLSCVWTYRANKHAGTENEMLLAILGGKIAKLESSMPKKQLANCKKQATAWSPAKPTVKNKK